MRTEEVLFLVATGGGEEWGHLHFHQFLRATDGPETRIEAQECGHWLIQPSDPKNYSTTITTIDDAVQ